MAGNLHKDKYTFLIISRAILGMRNVSDKGYSVLMATLNILFTLRIQMQWDILDYYKMKITTFFPESCAIYDAKLKILYSLCRPQMTTMK